MEIIKVKNLEPGKTCLVVGDFAKQVKPQQQGTYNLCRLTDNTGTAFARVWSNLPISPEIVNLTDGAYVEAEVLCTENGNYINIEIKAIKEIVRPMEAIVDIEGLKAEVREIIRNMKDVQLRNLVLAVLNREDIKELFPISPASLQSGYSFDGALLAHVVRTIRLSKAVVNVMANWNHNMDNSFSKLNEDLLVTASFLHDIGKPKALNKNGNRIEKTNEGELFEDSYISMKIINEELAKSDIPEEQRMIIEHVIGSSKGKQGYGALFLPRSKEAMAFHLIESLDVQMANFEFLERTADTEQTFVQLFQKTMFLGSYGEA